MCITVLQLKKGLGAVHKSAQNLEKIDPPTLSAKCPHWLNPPLPPYLCGHIINFKISDVFFFYQKVRMSAFEEALPLVRKMAIPLPPP